MARPQVDPDAWWHIRVGEWIVANGALPRRDLISWWAAGSDWMSPSWLNEVLLWVADQLGGATAQSVLYLPVFVAIVLLIDRCLAVVEPRLRYWHRLLLIVPVTLAMSPVLLPRAGNWDLLFALFAVLGWLRWRAAGSTTVLYVMPIAAIAWANLHGGGVLVYYALLLAFLIGSRIDRDEHPKRRLSPVATSALLTSVALAVNGYGLEIYTYPWSTILSSAQTTTILEWMSPDLADLSFWPVRALIALGLVVGLARARQSDAAGAFIVGGMLFLSLGSARYLLLALPLFAVWYMTPVVRGLLEYVRADTRVNRALSHPWLSSSLPASTLVLALSIFGAASVVQLLPEGQARALSARYPAGTIDVLAECEGRLWTDYQWGGWASYHLRRPVGPYGAADSLGDDRLLAAAGIERGTLDPAIVFDPLRVELVLTQLDSPPGHWLEASPNWEIVATDRISLLAARPGSGCGV